MASFFFFNDTATTEIYTLSLHDALPIYRVARVRRGDGSDGSGAVRWGRRGPQGQRPGRARAPVPAGAASGLRPVPAPGGRPADARKRAADLGSSREAAGPAGPVRAGVQAARHHGERRRSD